MQAQLVEAGYTSESVRRAVEARDLNLLVHPGRYQVQLPPVTLGGSDSGTRGGEDGDTWR